jgi:hypothetical protein
LEKAAQEIPMDHRNRNLWIVIVLAFFAGWQASQ